MVGPALDGIKTRLRPLEDGDLLRRTAWMNDPESVRLFTGSPPEKTYLIPDAERWRRNLEADTGTLVWAIEAKNGRHIGDVDLHDISYRDGSAKLTVLIGDKAYWGRGYGTDAISALLRHAFTELGLSQVNLKVFDFNERAIRCYEKCGFTRGSHYTGPGEVFMVARRETFMAMNSDVGTVSAGQR